MSSHDAKAGSTASLNQKLNADPELINAAEEALQKKLTEAEEKANQHWERVLRMQADADNLQRRVERDISNAHKYALEKFVSELLPVIDNLERAIATHVSEESGAGSLLDGVNLTLKMFCDALEKFGVVQVNPIRDAFNPEFHQAVSTQVEASAKAGTVLSVLQKGYLLNNRLVRPALVVVAK